MPEAEQRQTPIYLYLDEAGDFNFSPSGSRFFILTCAVMRRPFEHISAFATIKYDCLESRYGQACYSRCHEFHATEDHGSTRRRVFGAIRDQLPGLSVYSVVIRKNKTNPVLRAPEEIYSRTFGWLIGYVARCEGVSADDLVIAITDEIKLKGKNEALKAALKRFMKTEFEAKGVPYRLYQHRSESDFNLQIADYCCWAIQRKWEQGDSAYYETIKATVRAVGDLFKKGKTVYYGFDGK